MSVMSYLGAIGAAQARGELQPGDARQRDLGQVAVVVVVIVVLGCSSRLMFTSTLFIYSRTLFSTLLFCDVGHFFPVFIKFSKVILDSVFCFFAVVFII